MTQQELIDRINLYFEQPIQKTDAHLEELNLLYFYTSGIKQDCKPCQYVERRKYLKYYLAFPKEPYTLNPTIIIKPMATKSQKYIVNPDIKEVPTVRLGAKGNFVNLTNENMTDAHAQELLANPKYAHLVVENPAYIAPEEPQTAKKSTKKDSE